MLRSFFHSNFLLVVLILVMGLVVGCTPAGDDAPNAAATPTTDPNAPVSSDDPTPTPEPTLSGDLVIGTAIVNSVDLLMMESFPLQMNASIQGDFPDGCTSLGGVTQEQAGNVINITVMTTRPADQMCDQALAPFTESVPVDIYGLPAGEYTVNVNGVTATFTLDMDNILPEE